jgi:ribosomal protein S8
MLTRIRNANSVFDESVDIPASNLKKSICDVLKEEGYIKDYRYIEDGKQGILRVMLKYKGTRRERKQVIRGIVRVSKAGRRVYWNSYFNHLQRCYDRQDCQKNVFRWRDHRLCLVIPNCLWEV